MWQSFEGVVLFSRTHREHDGLVKIFTKEFGTKMFFVRHFKKANHPMGSQLFALTRNQYVGQINEEGLSFLKEAQTLDFNRSLQTDYLQQAYALYCAQLVDAALEEGIANERVYSLFLEVLENLNSRHLSEITVIYFEIALLNEFGVGLNWKSCVVCDEFKEPFDFSLRLMGLLCPNHYINDHYRLNISPKAMHVAIMLANHSLNQIQSVSVSKKTLSELRRLMDQIYQDYIGLTLKSRCFLKQMEQMEQSVQRLKVQRKSHKERDNKEEV